MNEILIPQPTLQRINPDTLDAILAEVKQQKITGLALFGPDVDVDLQDEFWVKRLKYYPCIYQLSSPVSNLGEKLRRLPHLSSLLLNSISLEGAEVEHIASLVNLTRLELRRNQIGDAGAKQLASLVNLTELDLTSYKIEDEGVKYLTNLVNLTTLRLHSGRIGTEGAKHLASLVNLTSLDLRGDQIGAKGAKYLTNLVNLTTLRLRTGRIGTEGAKHLASLVNLTSLDLQGNQIGDAGAKYLMNLVNLIELDLGSNQIRAKGAKYLANLVNLTSLHLLDNQIGTEGTKHLANLVNLTSLYLRGNQIGDEGAKYLTNLVNLIELGLSSNQIRAEGAKYLANLVNLTSLYLRENQITDTGVNCLIELKNLSKLDLADNNIQLLNPLSELLSLRNLNLSNTSVTDLSPLRRLLEQGVAARWGDRYWREGIHVENCPLIHPPPEIVQQGHEAVLDYFREIDVQGVASLYEAKVLIVGEGRAGKTSLLCRLYQPDRQLPTEDETTRGIAIQRFDFATPAGKTFRLNVWDFGGQQIYHATHQFFFTKNSLYILVDDTAKDYRSVTDEGFRYWFEVIDLLSQHSPVLIFQNEKGGRTKSIDIAGIKGRFDDVKEVFQGDLANPRSVDKLAQAIAYHVQQLPHVGEQVPAKWVDIRQALEQKAEHTPYITRQQYFDLYGQYLPFDRAKALRLSQYLHDLGVFLHFQDEDVLAKTVILQNRWATEAVFRMIDDEAVKARLGRFTIADCERIWADSEYRDMHAELRALMEKFELCYALPDLPKNAKTWLMPQLLSPSMPSTLAGWEQPGDLVLTYRYQFLPKGLVNRLMVRKHRYVERPDLAWVNGVLFEAEGGSVLVQATARGNEIVLRARGIEAKTLLGIIAADLDTLHGSFSGLESKLEKLIPCICKQCAATAIPEMYNYQRLLKRKQDGKLSIECPASYEDVSIWELLDGFTPPSRATEMPNRLPKEAIRVSQPEPRTIKIFLASSEELRKDRDDFDLYFRQRNDALRKEGAYLEIIRWENFLDAMAETPLQEEYNRQVRACDIFVSLFMTKVGSYTEEEFDVAYQTFKQNGKPHIYTYFKDAPTSMAQIDKTAMQSLWQFQDKLKAMGHYSTKCL